MKSYITLLNIILTILIISSCSPKTVLLSNQKIYRIKSVITPPLPNKYELNTYAINNRLIVKLKDNNGIQTISFPNEIDSTTVLTCLDTIPLDLASENKLLNIFYFPEMILINEDSSFYNSRLKYYDAYFSIQPLIFTFKIRPALNITDEDSFPSKVETGINIGFSFGKKIQVYHLKDKENIFKEKLEKRSSYSYGAFLNFSATELNKANTRTASLLISRNVPVISLGGYTSYGFNRFSIGYGLGIDFAIGAYSKRWVYQGFAHSKLPWLWHGLFISFSV